MTVHTDSTAALSSPGNEASHTLEILAPARLHLGFMDPAGRAHRRFGSVGLAVDRPVTRIRMRPARLLSVTGVERARATRYIEQLTPLVGDPRSVAVHVAEAMPAHAGLGSGTQLALGLGVGLARWFRRELGADDVARALARGMRSGIGVGAFEQGGFLVDGGKGGADVVPPIVARCEVPARWRLLLVFDVGHQGLSGSAERQAFQQLEGRPAPGPDTLSALVLNGMLPALATGDCRGFGEAVTALQTIVGDHFAPVQGGRFASPAVGRALAWLHARGVHGIGQSSWGPTGFAICDGADQAEGLKRSLEAHAPGGAGLRYEIARPRNQPATIHVVGGDRGARDAWRH